MDWTIHINNLIYWANEKGYHVEMLEGGDDSICQESKLIEINSSSRTELQVIRLLHECGHALIFENGSSFNFKEKRSESESSVKYKVFTVIEEVEAWKRGRDLAKRLSIPIDDSEWEKDMVKALKKYINWASDLKEKIKDDKDANNSKSINKGSSTKQRGRASKKSTS
jgi:hypothetical protein